MKDYIRAYNEAYTELKEYAEKLLIKYGKEIDVKQIGKQILIQNKIEEEDEDLYDWMSCNAYTCIVETKNGNPYECTIAKVRYNNEKERIEVYLEDDYGAFCDWYPIGWITFGSEYVFMTIIDFID